MTNRHTLAVLVENKPGVLTRGDHRPDPPSL